MRITTLLAFIAALAFSGAAAAHGDSPRKSAPKKPVSTEEKPFGREGDPSKATRTIKVDMSDKMRFSPGELRIKAGQTIRFEVKNSGKTKHEMVLGTMQERKDHAEPMRKHPGMECNRQRSDSAGEVPTKRRGALARLFGSRGRRARPASA